MSGWSNFPLKNFIGIVCPRLAIAALAVEHPPNRVVDDAVEKAGGKLHARRPLAEQDERVVGDPVGTIKLVNWPIRASKLGHVCLAITTACP